MEFYDDDLPFITTDPTVVQKIRDDFYVEGFTDSDDIYQVVRPNGEVEQLRLGGDLRNCADGIIRRAYPGCLVTLLSQGEDVIET